MLPVPIILAALAALAPSPAAMVTAADPASVVRAMQDEGYRAKLKRDEAGDPLIESAADGTRFIVIFLGCTNGSGCTSVQFYAGFRNNGRADAQLMNDWNRTHRFARGYIDAVGDPVVEYDLDLDDGGMSAALFADNLEVWGAIVPAFSNHVARAGDATAAPATPAT